ncbi:MAG: TonB-dependent receptor [Magnetococcus sp. YQC-5]
MKKNRPIKFFFSFNMMMCVTLLPTSTVWSANAQVQQAQMDALLNMDFKELAEIRLTSAARKDQKLLDTAAAVTVIDQEEIRRSGMTSIPELLRMVPGLEVARINASNWAITARGFNAQFSNKLLVLMDGRTLYTPLFAGVNWNLQDVRLEDVERIEVIRGPGGTMWGANAVNGVINIITKKARDTQGWMLTAGIGTLEQVQGSLRYGGQFKDKMDYRVYGKGFEHEAFKRTDGSGARDSWEAQRGGFRSDWHLSQRDEVTLLGDVYQLREEPTDPRHGGDLLMHWTRTFQDASDFSLQLFYDRNVRSSVEESNLYDLDFQHRFHWSNNQEINWGMGYRLSAISLENSALVSWLPPSRRDQTFNLFLQDEIALQGKDLKLTLGTKVEHNDYTGLEYQPSARLMWHVTPQDTLWTAISRAVRTPSYTDTGFQLNTPLGSTTRLIIQGNPEVISETVWAYEVGYRTQPMTRLSLDVAAFYNRYDHLGTMENLPPLFNPITKSLTLAQTFANNATGATYGLETSVNWQAMESWKLRVSHTWLKMNLDLVDTSTDNSTLATANDIPRHQFQLRSYLNLPHDLELDAAWYHVSTLSHLNIPSVQRVDLRLGWKPTKAVHLSLAGQNLFDTQHPEFQGTSIQNSEIPRSFFAKLDWNF